MPRNGGDLDMPFAGESFKVQVRQAERDAQFAGQRTLGDSGVLLDLIEQLEVALGL